MKTFFRIIKNLFSFLYHKIINRLKGYKRTPQGDRALDYLFKVVYDNYEPQTLTDFTLEKQLELEGLSSEERMNRARLLFTILLEC